MTDDDVLCRAIMIRMQKCGQRLLGRCVSKQT
jgi:hypothetical protein